MKLLGIEIAIAVQGSIPEQLGVVPLDIEVPAELVKTDWTPLEVIVTVTASTGKFSASIRTYSREQDPNFRIDQNMIRDAVIELNKRIEAQRPQLAAPPAKWTDEQGRQALGAVQDALELGRKTPIVEREEGSRG
jgi:hypothetical protein